MMSIIITDHESHTQGRLKLQEKVGRILRYLSFDF